MWPLESLEMGAGYRPQIHLTSLICIKCDRGHIISINMLPGMAVVMGIKINSNVYSTSVG